jgi:hypothetical protein
MTPPIPDDLPGNDPTRGGPGWSRVGHARSLADGRRFRSKITNRQQSEPWNVSSSQTASSAGVGGAWSRGIAAVHVEASHTKPPGRTDVIVGVLIVLLLLCVVFGVGAVIKGIAWLAIVGLLLAVVLIAITIGQLRRSRT